MKVMFKELFQRNTYKYDYQYDWVILAEKKEKMEKKEERGREDIKEVWSSRNFAIIIINHRPTGEAALVGLDQFWWLFDGWIIIY